MPNSPVIRCGWCNKPVPQPESGIKAFCSATHEGNLKKRQRGKPVKPPTRDLSCFGCGLRANNSPALREVMALCIDCHWMSYAMCWRKERIVRTVIYEINSTGVLYDCPQCLGKHWTKNSNEENERIADRLDVCERIGDYVRRLGFDANQLRELPPHGWAADKVA